MTRATAVPPLGPRALARAGGLPHGRVGMWAGGIGGPGGQRMTGTTRTNVLPNKG